MDAFYYYFCLYDVTPNYVGSQDTIQNKNIFGKNIF